MRLRSLFSQSVCIFFVGPDPRHTHFEVQIAIIVNDMAAVNVDASLLCNGGAFRRAEARLVELTNGCICCTLRADLVEVRNALGSDLGGGMRRSSKFGWRFDYKRRSV